MWKILKDKAESIMKRLIRRKDRKKSAIERKLEKDNKDADGSVDSIRRREPIICTPT